MDSAGKNFPHISRDLIFNKVNTCWFKWDLKLIQFDYKIKTL